MLQEERERNTESLVQRDGSWSPYPWTISDSPCKASWLSPPQTLAASVHTDLVVQQEQREGGSLFVCCMCAWAGKLCDEGSADVEECVPDFEISFLFAKDHTVKFQKKNPTFTTHTNPPPKKTKKR